MACNRKCINFEVVRHQKILICNKIPIKYSGIY